MIFLAVFLLFAGTSIFFAAAKGLAVYSFIRLMFLVLFSLVVAKILKKRFISIENILAFISGLAIFESLVALLQFLKQSSLGLKFLGEPVFSPGMAGVAKIVIDQAKLIRAYGTFPHPNILAAFLLLGLFSCYYLWLRNTKEIRIYETMARNNSFRNFVKFSYFVALTIAIFLILLGLILTFSRSGWLIGVVATLFIIISERRAAANLGILLLAIATILLLAFQPYLLPRLKVSADEPSVSYRQSYNRLAVDLIKNNFFGVGIGNQVFYATQNKIYEKFGLALDWEKQPVHNLYLLIASEIGVLGLLAFLGFVIKILLSSKNIILIAMLSSLLLFGLFDHFLWTLRPGRLMLWLVIGIVIGVTGAHGSMDRAQPSEG